MRGENDPELEALQASVAARAVRTPTLGNSKTYGDWPHGDRRKKNCSSNHDLSSDVQRFMGCR